MSRSRPLPFRSNDMAAPGGPFCACGRLSRYESGWCGVLDPIACAETRCPACNSLAVAVYSRTRTSGETAADPDGWRCDECLTQFSAVPR